MLLASLECRVYPRLCSCGDTAAGTPACATQLLFRGLHSLCSLMTEQPHEASIWSLTGPELGPTMKKVVHHQKMIRCFLLDGFLTQLLKRKQAL
jgi:hypothetical protein